MMKVFSLLFLAFSVAVCQLNAGDQAALTEFYNSLTPSSQASLSWSLSNLCAEPEISCIGNRVTKLIISTPLTGVVPASFSNLESLITIVLNCGGLTGSVPNFANSTQISYIDLSGNQLTGTIPSTFPFPSLLTHLDLSNNQLSGSIPPEIGSLASLVEIFLTGNQLSGTIPTSFIDLINLIQIKLSNNQLTGTVPTLFSKLQELSVIDLQNNKLTGHIPFLLRTKSSLIEALFDKNYFECPSYSYENPATNDYISADNRCTTYCNGKCSGKTCSVTGLNYNTATCLSPRICVSELSNESGIAGDSIFLFGAHFNAEPSDQVLCHFGKKTSTGVAITPNIVSCTVPGGNPPGPIEAFVTINGVGQHCNAIFTYTSGTGNLDPHFHGFRGENMEIKRDENAANQLFHLYCSPSVTIIALFYEYADKLLFMTKFWVRLGDTYFTLNLSTRPKIMKGDVGEPFLLPELGRLRQMIDDGHLEWDDNMLRVTYKQLKINFSYRIYLNNSPYMNIDMFFRDVPNEPATGIIGRTVKSKLTQEQFEKYLQFKARVDDIVSFTCPSLSYDTI